MSSTENGQKENGHNESVGTIFGFDHIKFFVGNALQAADWYVTRFGFRRIAYSGLETGSRQYAAHVVRQNRVTFVFVSTLNPVDNEFSEKYAKHGDGVSEVAFTVDDCKAIYEKSVSRGAKSVSKPQELTDENGTVIVAAIQTYGDTIHTLVERKNYKGVFLPHYINTVDPDPFENFTTPVGLDFIDHCVGNQPLDEMETATQWYEKYLDFHRFWSVDDSIIHTEYSSLKSIVVTDRDENVKMPINEPAVGKRKSQIQEFCDYYGGPGVQHIALNTDDIITAVSNLRKRGVKFLSIPNAYYANLRQRLSKAPIKVAEELDILEKLHILVDFDEKGYLLQLFTKPVQDRPTFFLEVIQRRNHDGFGAGNFRALFEAIERDQADRGNL